MTDKTDNTIEHLAAELAEKLQSDPDAEKAFRADPVKFLEEVTGTKAPDGMRVEVHDNSGDVWHVPLGGGQLDDSQLDGVAGGCRGPGPSPLMVKFMAKMEEMKANGWTPPKPKNRPYAFGGRKKGQGS